MYYGKPHTVSLNKNFIHYPFSVLQNSSSLSQLDHQAPVEVRTKQEPVGLPSVSDEIILLHLMAVAQYNKHKVLKFRSAYQFNQLVGLGLKASHLDAAPAMKTEYSSRCRSASDPPFF
ncbi:MAG: hypothetical protein ABSC55_29210 [Syntrophorhabdales bacterium]|jgi:hypothetical protein